mgnify:CR=1 FL=1
MVCAESLSCGTPVVGFKAGGPESIGLADYCEFVEYPNLDKLQDCVMNWIDKKIDKQVKKVKVAKKAVNKNVIDILKKEMGEVETNRTIENYMNNLIEKRHDLIERCDY